MTVRMRLVVLLFAFFTGIPAIRADAPAGLGVDESRLVRLPGNTRPEATTANDRGPVADSFPLDHLQLQLRRSPEREREVAKFVDSQHDTASPNFHHWLTTAQFGARFGMAEADLRRISTWLRFHGFTVNAVTSNRMTIDFSGTAAELRAAFHTTLHRYRVDGQDHIANQQDPSIPADLAPLVTGVVSMHDFRPHRHIRRPTPRYTGLCQGSSCYLVTPLDIATIYNFRPLFAAGVVGTGQSIAVAEDSDLYSAADWTNFRAIFGVSTYGAGSLATIHPNPTGTASCIDPGVNADDIEATVDAEWASAAAPGAQIVVASCAGTAVTDGVSLAIQNLINLAVPPPILSISYGFCEAEDTTAAKTQRNSLFQQGAATGMSIFVSTGDNGPSDCAANGAKGTPYGIGINSWAATQYNVAVGGTDFADTATSTNATYWGTTNAAPWNTAKSYIPEIPWNDTCASTLLAQYYSGIAVPYGVGGFCNSPVGRQFTELGGGEGGPSGCYYGAPSVTGVVGGGCSGYAKPSWQSGVVGIPADGVRDIPDVSMFAGDGIWMHQYTLCFTDPKNQGVACVGDPATWAQAGGGTSFATPIVAGIQALANQKLGGRRLGNPNYPYYKFAAALYGPGGNQNCNSTLGNGIGSTCIFNDVTLGDNNADCQPPYNCYDPSGSLGVLSTSNGPAYKAGIGYDLATGLGSINVANLVNDWAYVAALLSAK